MNSGITFGELKKNLKKDSSALPVVRIAVVADSASQFFVQALKGYGIERGFNFEIYEGDYNQVDQQLLNPSSELYASSPHYIVLFHSAQKLLRTFYASSASERATFSKNHLAHVRSLVEHATHQSSARVIYLNLPGLDDSVFGNYGNKQVASWIYQRRAINFGLMELAAENGNLFIADLEQLVTHYGMSSAFDAKMYITADMVLSLDILPAVARNITDIIAAISGRFRKCLILDLDNTTWGGIIGDDGIENIQVGDLGTGKAFTQLQLWAKQLKERGIILAVCSKNTDSVAREPFEKHPDMVLRLEDIAVFVANWENKVDNIRHIQSVLNIGFDSMVFLDDNPFERNIIRENIPELMVPELPEDPAEYIPYLRTLNLFETASYAADDLERTRQYQEESKRVQLQRTFHSEDEYLQSLNMTAEVKRFDKFTVPRVAQLSQRSNQFNLRTRRYTEEDILRIAQSDFHTGITFSLRDRFGDSGLIAVVILEHRTPEQWFIDTWLMSCRVLKRGMESFTLNTIVKIANDAGVKQLVGEYIPTPKNGMVSDHYLQLGFTETNGLWTLDVPTYQERACHISVQTQTA